MSDGGRKAIVLACDGKLFPAAAFQIPRLQSFSPPTDVDIVIATETAEDIRKATAFGLQFQPLLFDVDLVSHIRMVGSFARASYYRIFLARLLRQKYRRLLYIDVDTYVQDDRVFRVLEIPMNGHAIAGVRGRVPYMGGYSAELRETTRSAGNKYLNSGVLLIDVEAFINLKIEQRTLDVASSRPMRFADQSALNTVLDGNWLELSPSFNMQINLCYSFVAQVCEPIIVHFSGSTKPWEGPRFQYDHPARAEMERFFPKSPWPGFLAGFYNLADAMAGLRESAKIAEQRPRFDPKMSHEFCEYLRSTRFADVETGLTALRPQYLPSA